MSLTVALCATVLLDVVDRLFTRRTVVRAVQERTRWEASA